MPVLWPFELGLWTLMLRCDPSRWVDGLPCFSCGPSSWGYALPRFGVAPSICNHGLLCLLWPRVGLNNSHYLVWPVGLG